MPTPESYWAAYQCRCNPEQLEAVMAEKLSRREVFPVREDTTRAEIAALREQVRRLEAQVDRLTALRRPLHLHQAAMRPRERALWAQVSRLPGAAAGLDLEVWP